MTDEPLPPPAGLGDIRFSPGAEDWIEFGPAGARVRIGFHDYAALYAVPGLYERVFYNELGMSSSHRVVGLYAQVLTQLGRPSADERVVDLGAGNGLGGEALRHIGVGRIVGVDVVPEARTAALRDRPEVYDGYLVGDLATLPAADLVVLTAMEPTAVLALSAIGPGHALPGVLDGALRLLPGGGLFAFAVMPTLLPGSADSAGQRTGYPDFLSDLFARRAEVLVRQDYVHRRQTNGADHLAVALVGRVHGS